MLLSHSAQGLAVCLKTVLWNGGDAEKNRKSLSASGVRFLAIPLMQKVLILATGEIREVSNNVAFGLVDSGKAAYWRPGEKKVAKEKAEEYQRQALGYNIRQMTPESSRTADSGARAQRSAYRIKKPSKGTK